MARILITDGIDKCAADALCSMGHELVQKGCKPEELLEEVKDCNALIMRSVTKVTKAVIDAANTTKKLKLIIRAGVGTDNIDVPYANQNGIEVANTPNASSVAVAELAIAHMFVLARHLHSSNVTMRSGQWNKKEYMGIELTGKTLGLIGFGRIAQETAKRAYAIGMKVIYTCRSGKKEGFDVCGYGALDELLKNSDFISLHIPYDVETGAVLGEREFALMKEGAYIVNCARGVVVDEDSLLCALDTGKIAGAALDVFAEEPTRNEKLYTHPKVSLSPHIGASTAEAQEKIGQEIIDIVRKRLR